MNRHDVKRPGQLSKRPLWETNYIGPIGARYSSHAGMYFEVTLSRLYGWWHIDRITANGHYLGESMTVPTLSEATDAIRTWNGHHPPERLHFNHLAVETMITAEELEEAFHE